MSTDQEAPGSERGPIAAFVQAHRLSPQEARLIKAALRELSNEEIASELGCSASTIRTYWSRIFQKVGCSRHHHVFARITRFILSRADVPQLREPGDASHASAHDGRDNLNELGSLGKTIAVVSLLVSCVLGAGALSVARDREPKRDVRPRAAPPSRWATSCTGAAEQTCPGHQPSTASPLPALPSPPDFRSFQEGAPQAGRAASCSPGEPEAPCYGAPPPSVSSSMPNDAEKPGP